MEEFSINSSSPKSQTKFMSAKSQNLFLSELYLQFKDWRAKNVDQDEVAHHEPPHPDLHCLQILRFSFLVLKVIN